MAKKSKPAAPKIDLQVEIWPITRPTPYERNARIITDAAVEIVAKSLKEFGWQQPIVVDAAGSIIAGHTRLKAAQSLGMTEVPVSVARTLTPAQVTQYRLMDNRSNEESLWDNELLKVEMQLMADANIDLDMTGFSTDEVDTLLKIDDLPPEAPEEAEDLERAGPAMVDCPQCGHHFNPDDAESAPADGDEDTGADGDDLDAAELQKEEARQRKARQQRSGTLHDSVDSRSPGDILKGMKRTKRR